MVVATRGEVSDVIQAQAPVKNDSFSEMHNVSIDHTSTHDTRDDDGGCDLEGAMSSDNNKTEMANNNDSCDRESLIETNPSLTNWAKNENGEDETVSTDESQNTVDIIMGLEKQLLFKNPSLIKHLMSFERKCNGVERMRDREERSIEIINEHASTEEHTANDVIMEAMKTSRMWDEESLNSADSNIIADRYSNLEQTSKGDNDDMESREINDDTTREVNENEENANGEKTIDKEINTSTDDGECPTTDSVNANESNREICMSDDEKENGDKEEAEVVEESTVMNESNDELKKDVKGIELSQEKDINVTENEVVSKEIQSTKESGFENEESAEIAKDEKILETLQVKCSEDVVKDDCEPGNSQNKMVSGVIASITSWVSVVSERHFEPEAMQNDLEPEASQNDEAKVIMSRDEIEESAKEDEIANNEDDSNDRELIEKSEESVVDNWAFCGVEENDNVSREINIMKSEDAAEKEPEVDETEIKNIQSARSIVIELGDVNVHCKHDEFEMVADDLFAQDVNFETKLTASIEDGIAGDTPPQEANHVVNEDREENETSGEADQPRSTTQDERIETADTTTPAINETNKHDAKVSMPIEEPETMTTPQQQTKPQSQQKEKEPKDISNKAAAATSTNKKSSVTKKKSTSFLFKPQQTRTVAKAESLATIDTTRGGKSPRRGGKMSQSMAPSSTTTLTNAKPDKQKKKNNFLRMFKKSKSKKKIPSATEVAEQAFLDALNKQNKGATAPKTSRSASVTKSK